MTTDDIADDPRLRETSLAQSALFGPLANADRLWIAEHVQPVTFAAGTTIFACGDEPDGLYVLQSGGVAITFHTSDGRTFSIALAAIGGVFGEIAVLDGGRRSADARAVTEVAALKMTRETLQHVMKTNARVLDAVIRFLCERVRDTDRKLEAIALQSVEARIARFLLNAVRSRARASGKGLVPIALGISASDLGLLVGEGRAQVGAALAQLETERAFYRDGGQMVCDMTRLARIADQGWD